MSKELKFDINLSYKKRGNTVPKHTTTSNTIQVFAFDNKPYGESSIATKPAFVYETNDPIKIFSIMKSALEQASQQLMLYRLSEDGVKQGIFFGDVSWVNATGNDLYLYGGKGHLGLPTIGFNIEVNEIYHAVLKVLKTSTDELEAYFKDLCARPLDELLNHNYDELYIQQRIRDDDGNEKLVIKNIKEHGVCDLSIDAECVIDASGLED